MIKPRKKLRSWIFKIFIGILAIIIFIFLASVYSQKVNPPAKNIKYGVTFTQLGAKHLKLDWKKTYLEVLDDLKVKNLRLSSYWSVIEKTQGELNFEETDFLVNEASKRGVEIVLTVGVKQPRWPECHVPSWVRKLSTKDRQEATLVFIQQVVERYKNIPSIIAWQVENEPFFYPYGKDCYPPDTDFLKKEIARVKSLDLRPVIISETGELTLWLTQMQLSDIFGTTLYRTVWNPVTKYFTYPLNPGYYSLRSNFYRKFFAPKNKKTIITELQAEPWIPSNNLQDTDFKRQSEIFPVSSLDANIDFAKKTSFDEVYLWGVEWWYYMKENGYPEYWEYAKRLF